MHMPAFSADSDAAPETTSPVESPRQKVQKIYDQMPPIVIHPDAFTPPLYARVSYTFTGTLIILCGIISMLDALGVWSIIPFGTVQEIASLFVILVGLWLVTKGWASHIMLIITGLLSAGVIGVMAWTWMNPMTMIKYADYGIHAWFEQNGEWLIFKLALGTGTDRTITAPAIATGVTCVNTGITIPLLTSGSTLSGMVSTGTVSTGVVVKPTLDPTKIESNAVKTLKSLE
jgi:hypothetical protein